MEIYTDGSCIGDNSGGFAVVVIDNNQLVDAHVQRYKDTTNNRMEILPILWSLEYYGKKYPPYVTVYTDSAYCYNTFTDWIYKWAKNGWCRPNGKGVKNLDLVKRYYQLLCEDKNIDLKWVKGHADTKGNVLADLLATGQITSFEEAKKWYTEH